MTAKPRKPPGAPRQLLVVDVDDHIDPTTRAWVTVDEDGRLVFPEASEAQAAELGARFEAWLLAQQGLTPEQMRWLGMVGSQIRANADTWTEITAGHFAFTPFTQIGGVGQAQRLFGGADKLETLLASLNAAVYLGTPRAGAGAAPETDYRGDATLP